MLHIPKIGYYLQLLTDEEGKEFVTINLSEYFKSMKEEQNIWKLAKLLHIFLATPDKVEKHVQPNSSDNCMHRYNVEILKIFYSEL